MCEKIAVFAQLIAPMHGHLSVEVIDKVFLPYALVSIIQCWKSINQCPLPSAGNAFIGIAGIRGLLLEVSGAVSRPGMQLQVVYAALAEIEKSSRIAGNAPIQMQNLAKQYILQYERKECSFRALAETEISRNIAREYF